LPYRILTNILDMDTTFWNFNPNYSISSKFFTVSSKFILQSIGRLLFQQMFCLKCLLQLHYFPLFSDSRKPKILNYELRVTSSSK